MTEAPDTKNKFEKLLEIVPDRRDRERKTVKPKRIGPPTQGDKLPKMNSDGTYPEIQEAEV